MADEPRVVKEITIAFNGDPDDPRIAERMDSIKALLAAWDEVDRRREWPDTGGSVAWSGMGDARAPKVCVAVWSSGSYTFTTIGATEDEARQTLRDAWLMHVETVGGTLDHLDADAVWVLSGPAGTAYRDEYRMIEGSHYVSGEPPEPDDEDDESHIIDFDRIAARLMAEHGIPAHVEQTGGNVATLYIGTNADDQEITTPTMAYAHMAECMRAPVLLGPGWFEGPGWTNARGSFDELFLGPDDQGQTKHYEPEDEDDIVKTAAFLYSRVAPHLKCQPKDHVFTVECHIERSHDGNTEHRPCNDDQQHHDKQGRMCCNDCGALLFHCETTGWYHHADITAPVCFLAKT